jgi:chemotaxis protein methyltransferase CheR
VSDRDCVAFLQWALPQANLRWPGFRKVRGQVCKRLKRRMNELGLEDFAAYRARLRADATEWVHFDACCRITISRFFRNARVFETLRRDVLPEIGACAARAERDARVWSAGCASGEEPYTLKILWDLEVARAFPEVSLSVVGTDIDEAMLARARAGYFAAASLRELPPHLVDQAFDQAGSRFCFMPRHRFGIEFRRQDLRTEMPALAFDLILCRYLAFTYFAMPLQVELRDRMVDRLSAHGYLVVGTHERLPDSDPKLFALPDAPQIFARRSPPHG